MAGDARDRRLDHAPHRRARLRPGVPAGEPSRSAPDDDYGTLAARLRGARRRAARARARRAPAVRRAGRGGVTYAHKIEAARPRAGPDARARARSSAPCARCARTSAPGCRCPTATFLGVLAARVPTAPTLAPAGGRVRADGERLLLDCHGGALELTRDPPARRAPDGRRATGCAAGPDPALTSFWLDPRAARAPARGARRAGARGVGLEAREWAPHLAALAWRGDAGGARRAARAGRATPTRRRAASPPTCSGSSARPRARSRRARRPRCSRRWPAASTTRTCSRRSPARFGHLGEPHGHRLAAAAAPPPGRRRCATASPIALAGRADPRAVDALIELSSDPDSGDPRLGDVRARHAGARRHARAARRAGRAARRRRPRDRRGGGPRARAARRRARRRGGAAPARPQAPARIAVDAPRARGGDDPAGRAHRRRALRARTCRSTSSAWPGRRWRGTCAARCERCGVQAPA